MQERALAIVTESAEQKARAGAGITHQHGGVHSACARFAHGKAETCLTVPASCLAKFSGEKKKSATLPQGAHRVTVGAKQCLLGCCGATLGNASQRPLIRLHRGLPLTMQYCSRPAQRRGHIAGTSQFSKIVRRLRPALSRSLDTVLW